MNRITSVEAYHKVEKSGLLSALRLEVYRVLCYYGPMTANEMSSHCKKVPNSGVWNTRLSELERMKAVRTTGKRECRMTGYNALVWEVTGEMPVKLSKPLSKKEKKVRINLYLKEIQSLVPGIYQSMVEDVMNQVNNL